MKKLLLSCLLVLFAIPAFAFSVPMPEGMKLDLYASIRMVSFYQSGFASSGIVAAKSNFAYNLQGNSRVGFRFSYDNLFTNIETNFNADGTNPNGFGFRQFYAGYNFSNGLTFTAGRMTTVAGINGTFNDFYFTDNGLGGFGALLDSRRTQVRFSFMNIDLSFVDNTNEGTTPSGFTLNNNMPRYELAYNLKFGKVSGKVFASYALYSLKRTATDASYNVNTFTVGGNVKPTFGNMYVNIGLFYAMNGGMQNAVKFLNFGATGISNLMPQFSAVDDKFHNVNSLGVVAEFGMKFNDMASMVLGGGYQLNMSDYFAAADDKNRITYAIFANAPIKLAKYITLKPGVGYYTAQIGSSSAGLLLAGVQLRFDF